MPITRVIATLALLVSLVGNGFAGSLEDALAAYRKGDYGIALRLLRPLAEQGHPFAQYTIGYMYAFGQGVPENRPESVKWYRKAADQGYVTAQMMLGLAYAHGSGVAKNDVQAAKLYRKAAEQGFAPAQHLLGTAYARGQGVQKNFAEATQWHRKAAVQGLAGAQASRGALLKRDGKHAEAIRWLREAANQDNAGGQGLLGAAYMLGEGVPADKVIAYMWLNLASAKSDTIEGFGASVGRGLLEKTMTSAEIAEGQRLAREWKPKPTKVTRADSPTKPAGRFLTDDEVFGRRDDSTSITLLPRSSKIEVPLKLDGTLFVVPVELNGAIKLNFTVDSAASDVSVPLDVFTTLKRTGTIKDSDLLESQTYVLADGSKSRSARFMIRSLKVGDAVLTNVAASVSSSQGMLLLGQSFLTRFKSWSIHNTSHKLHLETH